jgi:large subunit ribosomal protein L24
MAHVKKGDTVLVIAGKDKGVKGTVLSVLRDVDKVLVEGVNRVKRHTKVTTGARGVAAGGIQIQEAPIHISNVKLLKDEKKKEKETKREQSSRPANKKESKKDKKETEKENEDFDFENEPSVEFDTDNSFWKLNII